MHENLTEDEFASLDFTRVDEGTTAEQFADAIGVTRQSVGTYETGAFAPRGDVFSKIIAVTTLTDGAADQGSDLGDGIGGGVLDIDRELLAGDVEDLGGGRGGGKADRGLTSNGCRCEISKHESKRENDPCEWVSDPRANPPPMPLLLTTTISSTSVVSRSSGSAPVALWNISGWVNFWNSLSANSNPAGVRRAQLAVVCCEGIR